MAAMEIHFTLNGQPVTVQAEPDEMLLEVLRRELGLRSVRETCGLGICGACTALLNGQPISTCILLAPLAEGCEITTVEGLGGRHPVQRAFEEVQAFQCGYCTPGMILTIKALLEEQPEPDEETIRRALGGNLCRCGCYLKIIQAAQRAAALLAEERRRQPQPGPASIS
ncbi:(2Fe-2S)-binding protein [Thermogemmatispora sp.]|uniref:(2Fe-2S)-binding protein n=1 Tax=Thermogemmatispora sp. TaxID=1968838 RepID=UPI00260CCC1D|nr:(2Fe-2S)-binding protein [Thermogemmatispora sp.]